MTADVDGFPVLDNNAEVLWRQVHPAQVTDGEAQSVAFLPSAAHEYLLSTSREWIGAKRAYVEHLGRGLESEGSWSFTVGDASATGLQVFDDSSKPTFPPGHASVDFRDLSDPVRRKKARRLKEAAGKRGGRVYPAEPELAEDGPASAEAM